METWLTLAIPLTERFEGCRLTAYPDPATGGDPWTIGWGSTGPNVRPGVTWTQQQCDEDLEVKLTHIGAQIDTVVTVPLSDHEKAALACFIYNVGFHNFVSSTLLRKLNARDREGAADQFLRWDRANGKQMRGLSIRRAAERSMFLWGT